MALVLNHQTGDQFAGVTGASATGHVGPVLVWIGSTPPPKNRISVRAISGARRTLIGRIESQRKRVA